MGQFKVHSMKSMLSNLKICCHSYLLENMIDDGSITCDIEFRISSLVGLVEVSRHLSIMLS